MRQYLIRRLLSAAVVLWGVSLLSFGVAYALPGDPAVLIAGAQASPETVAGIRRELRLDAPLPEQYLVFARRTLAGDLGRSYTGEPVAEAIGRRLPPTALL